MRESSIESCPVPQEQQPVNEYQQLKESWFFHWPTLETVAYSKKLAYIWLWGWILTSPIAAEGFAPAKKPILFILSGSLGTTILLSLVLLRLYLGWFYVGDRLKSDQVFYEESGWYDGQVWQKTSEVLTRDRLILSYQVEPILKRLKQTGLILAGFLGGNSILWFCLDRL